ncbi:MAG: IS21 family transposase, partial [Myxococcota bacterium]|nr:IS21 family transposase [Myxococcota bacterium]
MVSDAQVLLLRKKLMTMTQEAAAAAAGMSVRTARKWQRGGLPSVRAVRSWRTRPDPFAEVWAKEVVPILEQDKD